VKLAIPEAALNSHLAILGRKPQGGHWNSHRSILRQNGLVREHGDALFITDDLEGA